MAIVGSNELLLCISIIIFYMFGLCFTEDASRFFDFDLSYITASPLGVPQQVMQTWVLDFVLCICMCLLNYFNNFDHIDFSNTWFC